MTSPPIRIRTLSRCELPMSLVSSAMFSSCLRESSTDAGIPSSLSILKVHESKVRMETCRNSSSTLSSVPAIRDSRRVSVRTALREKLSTRSWPGDSPALNRSATRSAAISVFPVPGPASTSIRTAAPAASIALRTGSSSGRLLRALTLDPDSIHGQPRYLSNFTLTSFISNLHAPLLFELPASDAG